ncbi:MAG: hypothetical protein K0R85_2424 [Devosia sp.]|jgi:DNA-binding transcriptional LysR family regulator|nr:hypothetical protein [Devosia sp.]
MLDLNDLYYFHAVAAHGGFTAASRVTGTPKATLSKRVAQLEAQLGVRLLERTTRHLRLTEVGRAVFDQAETMLEGAEGAQAVAAQAQTEPNGIVRLSCPQGLLDELINDLLPGFLTRYPRVRVQVKIIDRTADLVEDGVDVALRARSSLDADPNLIVRRLGQVRGILVASPSFLEAVRHPITIDTLPQMPMLSGMHIHEEVNWDLTGPDGEIRKIRNRPRLICSSFVVLRTSAIAGLGVTVLPEYAAAPAFARGELVHLLPGWYTPHGIIHAVFSSRKGLVPAVRVLLDYLAGAVPDRLATCGQLANEANAPA